MIHIIIAFLFGMYATRLVCYYKVAFHDDYWLVECGVANDPGSWYGWFMRAFKRANQKAIRESLNCFVMAKMVSPKEFKVLFNIAVILKSLQQEKEADHYFNLAEQNIIEGQGVNSQELLMMGRRGDGRLVK